MRKSRAFIVIVSGAGLVCILLISGTINLPSEFDLDRILVSLVKQLKNWAQVCLYSAIILALLRFIVPIFKWKPERHFDHDGKEIEYEVRSDCHYSNDEVEWTMSELSKSGGGSVTVSKFLNIFTSTTVVVYKNEKKPH